MKGNILDTIYSKNDYMTALEAVIGEKQSYTEDEKAKLLEIYADNAKNKMGFGDEIMVKAVLALDVPGANLLDKADADALVSLRELCADWERDPEKANAVKDAALAGDVSKPLALAMARAALDALAGQKDTAVYREDIAALAEFLKSAEEETFAEASRFLLRVRERVR